MRTTFFFFTMLASMTASATVTVTPLNADYSTKKVTFKVEWTNTPIAPCNNRVWIWIDFCPVNGVTPQSFSTATIDSPAITGGNGTITNPTARGFFIEYAATNAGTTVTATLSNAPAGKFNWCVHGSTYPPNIGDYNNGIYTLRGTPPFTLYDENGTTQIVKGTTIARSSLNIEPITMTDATGCPGNFCKYVGSDLYMNATTYKCQQRTSGAQNWEAWIKDTRDDNSYRIVLMPDNNWWLAQNVKYAHVGSAISGCTEDECGKKYTCEQTYASYAGGTSGESGNVQGICPPGWLLPIQENYHSLFDAITPANVSQSLRALKAACEPRPDVYGFASVYAIINGNISKYDGWYCNDRGREDAINLDYKIHVSYDQTCGEVQFDDPGECQPCVIRCMREP
ncbi:MAG: hypothetical protein LBF81_00295 [Prevotellaceae bacterium]|jgi:uncharacterized protein (TIGR02145 family)|nr:hypothetical protein [Prevotellaceae bacterium]